MKYKDFSFPKEKHLKIFETCDNPYLCLNLVRHVNKNPNNLVKQSLEANSFIKSAHFSLEQEENTQESTWPVGGSIKHKNTW
jgi:hypothetical protein